jgi:hypothetical protein
MARKSRTKKLVASICLYGNHDVGFDYLAELPDGSLWGQPSPEVLRFSTATDCLMMFRADLSERGICKGKVMVFAPGGLSVAYHELHAANPFYFGSLKWEAAMPTLVLSADDVMAASGGAK